MNWQKTLIKLEQLCSVLFMEELWLIENCRFTILIHEIFKMAELSKCSVYHHGSEAIGEKAHPRFTSDSSDQN